MSSCKLDHTLEDVMKKLTEQKNYLPKEIFKQVNQTLVLISPTQSRLNEVFHLLKKYDLANEEEQMERNAKLEELFK